MAQRRAAALFGAGLLASGGASVSSVVAAPAALEVDANGDLSEPLHEHLFLLQGTSGMHYRGGRSVGWSAIGRESLGQESLQPQESDAAASTSEKRYPMKSHGDTDVDDVWYAVEAELRHDVSSYWVQEDLTAAFKNLAASAVDKAYNETVTRIHMNPRAGALMKIAVTRGLQDKLQSLGDAFEEELASPSRQAKEQQQVEPAEVKPAVLLASQRQDPKTGNSGAVSADQERPKLYPMKPHGDTLYDDIMYAVEAELKHDVSSYWVDGDLMAVLQTFVSKQVDQIYNDTLAKSGVNPMMGGVMKASLKRGIHQKLQDLETTMEEELAKPVSKVSASSAEGPETAPTAGAAPSLVEATLAARGPAAAAPGGVAGGHLQGVLAAAAKRLAAGPGALDRRSMKLLARGVQKRAAAANKP